MDNTQRLNYLQAMGIEVWVPKSASITPTSIQARMIGTASAPEFVIENAVPYAQLNWEALSRVSIDESACVIVDDCKKYTPNQNNQQADWLVIIDAPIKKDHFAHEAELLLTEMLSAIGLARAQVFMTRVVDDQAIENGTSTTKTPSNCTGFLTRQIELLRPKIILVLGALAAKNVLQTNAPIAELRGFKHNFAAISTLVTYHPAYLLDATLDKRLVWQDLQLAMRTFNQNATRDEEIEP